MEELDELEIEQVSAGATFWSYVVSGLRVPA